MVTWLTYIGLALTPFILVKGYDGRYPKEIFALGVASAIALYAIYQGQLKPCRNRCLLLLLCCMLLSCLFVPPSGIMFMYLQDKTLRVFDRTDVDNLWNYKPILYALIYLLMCLAIAGAKVTHVKRYFEVVSWTGSATALLIILQKLGFTQFWVVKPTSVIGTTVNPELVAMIGQPTLVAAFLAITFPTTFFLKRYWMTALIFTATVLTGSAFGLLSVLCATIMHFTRKNRVIFLSSFFVMALAAFAIFKLGYSNNHGRFEVWQQIYHDLTHRFYGDGASYGLTGFGPGAFHYVYPIIHNNGWQQAHNEFFEVLFNNGAIGLILFVGAILTFLKQAWKFFDDDAVFYLTCVFLASVVIACGTFVWQLAFGQFYVVAAIGFAYNRFSELSDVNH